MTQDYAYHKRWRYEADHGLRRTMPAATVTTHLQALLDAGWSQRAIGDAAGVGSSTVHHILHGTHRGVKTDTARRLLGVNDATILTRSNRAGFVRRTGVQRRIQALLAIGHRHGDITAVMHAADPAVHTSSQLLLSQAGDWVTRATHDAVTAAYNQLSMTPGASTRTRNRARARGYLPCLAWDDDLIDEPTRGPSPAVAKQEVLDEIAVERAMRGDPPLRLSVAERTAAVARLTAQGISAAEISQRLHLTPRGVTRGRARERVA